MRPAFLIIIATKDGRLFEVERDMNDVQPFVEAVTKLGYLDADGSRFYPPEALVTIEVAPIADLHDGEFSDN